jgi:aspartyl-tRNA(Asn)/glutamyl-tRNA(Gln) amidotransferase subunit A
VRWPAAQCGITGLKPTYGRIPRTGVVPLAWSLDHLGVLTRTVEDAALLLGIVAGHDDGDPTSATAAVPDYMTALERPREDVRLGVPRQLFDDNCDPAILDCFEVALSELGRLGVEVVVVPSMSMPEVLATTYPALLAEAATYHLPDLQARIDEYGPDLRVFFAAGLLVDAESYLRCQRSRERLRRMQLAQLEGVDGFILPTVGFLADVIPDRAEGLSFLSGDVFPLYTMAYNLTGLPAISVPAGFTPSGLPVGLQVVGRPFDEASVLAIAQQYQRATPWFERRPPIASGVS